MARRDAAGTVRRRHGFRSKHFIFSRAAYGKRSNGLCPHCPPLSLGRQSVVTAIEEFVCKVIADDALSVCCSRIPSTFTPLFRRVQCRNSVCQSNSALRGARSQRSPRNRGPDLGRFRSPPRLRRCKGSGKSGRGPLIAGQPTSARAGLPSPQSGGEGGTEFAGQSLLYSQAEDANLVDAFRRTDLDQGNGRAGGGCLSH